MTRQRYVLLVDINPALSILGQPPAAVLGEAYSFSFQYFGGTAPYTCTVIGSVPTGWTFNAGTGVLSHPGPSTPGALSLTLKLRDADYRETAPTTYTWSVIALPLLITNALPDYTAGVAQSFSYTTTGGAGSKTFAVSAGSLPPGLSLSSAGAISGTTTGLSVGTHTYTFDVTATDAYGASATLSESVTVTVAALSITNAAPDGRVGVAYSHTYTKSGGTGAVTWAVASGTLPAGLSLSSAGVLSGTPTTQQTAGYTVSVTDAAATVASEVESVVIAYPTLTLSGTYAAATAGTAYSSDLTIAGGNGSYSNPRVTSGGLPSGLSLSIVGSALRLSGTPTASGTYAFTAAVDSGDGQTATSAQSVAVVVYATFNSADKSFSIVLSGSDMTAERSSGTGYASVRATAKMAASKKTQCEFLIAHVGPSPYAIVGIDDGTANISATFQIASDVHGYGYYQDTGQKVHSNVLATYGAAFKTDGDVITMLYDGPSGTLTFKKNGVSQGTAYTELSGDFYPAISIYSGDGSPKAQITLRTNPATMSYPESGYVGVTE